jgi:hypothetical protein
MCGTKLALGFDWRVSFLGDTRLRSTECFMSQQAMNSVENGLIYADGSPKAPES